MSVPSFDWLRSQLNRPFTLTLPDGYMVGELVSVELSTAMNARYQCYIVEFALPVGLNAPQATYEIRPYTAAVEPTLEAAVGISPNKNAVSNDLCWQVLLTPGAPDELGRGQSGRFSNAKFSIAGLGLELVEKG